MRKELRLFTSFFLNIQQEIKALFGKFFHTPFQSIAAFVAFVSSSISIYQFLFHDSGSTGGLILPGGLLASFPTRAILFLFVTGSIGWSIATIGCWLSDEHRGIKLFIAQLLTAFGALFSVACINWIFGAACSKYHELAMYCVAILGIVFSAFLVKTKFRLAADTNIIVVSDRANLVLSFCWTAAIFFIISQAIGFSQ